MHAALNHLCFFLQDKLIHVYHTKVYKINITLRIEAKILAYHKAFSADHQYMTSILLLQSK